MGNEQCQAWPLPRPVWQLLAPSPQSCQFGSQLPEIQGNWPADALGIGRIAAGEWATSSKTPSGIGSGTRFAASIELSTQHLGNSVEPGSEGTQRPTGPALDVNRVW